MTTKPQSTTEPGANDHVHKFINVFVPPAYGHSYRHCTSCQLSTHLPDHNPANCGLCAPVSARVTTTVKIPDGQWRHAQIKAGNPRVVAIQFETAEQASEFIDSFAAASPVAPQQSDSVALCSPAFGWVNCACSNLVT